MKFKWFSIYLLTFSALVFSDENTQKTIATSNIDATISATVNGCVNAITGDYLESSNDLIIPGPEPLIFERFYCSSDHNSVCLQNGWRHNHNSIIFSSLSECNNHAHDGVFSAQFLEKSGRAASYQCKYPKTHAAKQLRATIDWKKGGKGLTNCGSGIISGQTNPKNTILNYNVAHGIIDAADGAGNSYHFHERLCASHIKELMFEQKLNGCRFVYTYDDSEGRILDPENRLTKIALTNKNNTTTFGWIKITGNSFSHLKKHHCFEVEGSNHQKVVYKVGKTQSKRDKRMGQDYYFYIEEVHSSHSPWRKYKYTKRVNDRGQQISQKEEPNGRFLQIEYYNENDVDEKDFRINRVKYLRAPNGSDASSNITHRFQYFATTKKEKDEDLEVLEGYTEVYNAHNNKIVYGYTPQHRLSGIETYTGCGPYQLYSKESFLWGKENSQDAANLISKRLLDGQGQAITGHVYRYDAAGNVIHETVYGNVVGNSPPLIWGETDPIENGCDRYSKLYTYSQDGNNLILSQSEDNGNGIQYGYLPQTNLLAYKLLSHRGQTQIRYFYDYNEFGMLLRTTVDDGSGTDRNNLSGVTERRMTYIEPSRDNGLPLVVEERYYDLRTGEEKLVKRINNTYSQEGRLLQQDHFDSNWVKQYSTSWDYDAHGNVISELDALGHCILRTYNENDSLQSELIHGKHYLQYTYDYMNRLTCVQDLDLTDNSVLVTQHQYDFLGNRYRTIDPYGQETKFHHDDFGRVVGVEKPAIPNEQGELIVTGSQMTYDILGNVISATDGCGNVMHSSYNIHGKPTLVTYPDGTHESSEYYPDGALKKSTAKNGIINLYFYDWLGRQTQKEVHAADGTLLSCIKATYNAFHMTSSTDTEGNVTTYRYDKAGRLVSAVSDHSKTQIEYDSLGREWKLYEWYGEAENAYKLTVKTYDLLNHLLEEKVIDGQENELLRLAQYAYDSDDNLYAKTQYINNEPSTTYTTYNGRKQLIQTICPDEATIQVQYNHRAVNAYGQTVLETSSTDSLGNTVVTTSNALQKVGRVLKKNSMGKIIAKSEMFYSGIGDLQVGLETVIAPDGSEKKIETVWRRDSMHNLLELVEAVGTPEQKCTQSSYNHYGQKVMTVKPDGSQLSYTYDNKGRLKDLIGFGFSYKYTYDGSDHPILVEDLINQTQTTRTYSKGILLSEQLANGHVIQYQYDKLQRPIKVTFPDSSQVSYTYNASNLKAVSRLCNNQEIYTHQYLKYDLSGNVMTEKLIGLAGEINFSYDTVGRLSNMTGKSISEEIKYDAVGNLISEKIDSLVEPLQATYTYDDLYQLKSETGVTNHTYANDSLYNCVLRDGVKRSFNSLNQLLDEGANTYSYDSNGNMLVSNKATYAYDALDRLVTVTKDKERYSYTYDAFNRRLSKTVAIFDGDWKEINSISYFYIGQDEMGACDADGKIQELRLLGVGKGAEIGAAIAFEIDGKILAPLHNHVGHVIGLIDAIDSGGLVESYRYSAFGEEKIFDQAGNLVEESIIGNSWRFSSKRKDAETGFIYFGRRYYDPSICRWITADPLGIEGGPNLYAYVLNSPLCHIDLYGLEWERVGGRWERRGQGTRRNSKLNGQNSLKRFEWVRKCGRFAGDFVRHTCPIPILRDAGTLFASLISGDLHSWKSTFHEPRSQFISEGEGQASPNEAYCDINGICTSEEEHRQRLEAISKLLGGERVYGSYNSTHGAIADLGELVWQNFGFRTNSVDETAQGLEKLVNQVGPNGIVNVTVHSQGARIFYNAAQMLTPEQRRRLKVTAIGGVKIIDPEELGLAGAVNYATRLDFAPMLVDPIGFLKARFKNSSFFQFLPANNLLDHMYDNGPYKTQRELMYKSRISL